MFDSNLTECCPTSFHTSHAYARANSRLGDWPRLPLYVPVFDEPTNPLTRLGVHMLASFESFPCSQDSGTGLRKFTAFNASQLFLTDSTAPPHILRPS